METLVSFLAAAAVTMFFVRRYLKGLMEQRRQPAAAPRPGAPCPRCSRPVPEGSSFCAACGAALSMWNVHRARIAEASGAAAGTGKPRPVINASLCIGCASCVEACPEAGTLAVVSGKAILAHPERCVGHAKCVTACPTSALTLAHGNVLQTLRVPLVDERFETNVKGVYIVGELGGMGLIKTAINEGKLVIDHLRGAIGSSPAPEGCYDVLIVGSGPAGLSASLAAAQHGLRYLTLEQSEIASTIRNYPRHKFLMAEPVEMPLYGALYISDSTKEALLSVWETILANTGVRINTNERVEQVQRNGEGFLVRSTKGDYRARHVVLAMGKRGTPRRLGVPGEELAKVAYRLIEAETYSGKDVLVVGGGDSAVEAALALSTGGRNRVALSYRGAEFTRIKQRNRTRLAEAEQTGALRVLRQTQVVRISEESVTLNSCGEMPNDYVFVLIGGESPEEFLRRTGIEIVEKVVSA